MPESTALLRHRHSSSSSAVAATSSSYCWGAPPPPPTTAAFSDDDDDVDPERERYHRGVSHFFVFLCASTALRSFEAGVVSSMMPSIRSDLRLTYSQEGTVAAAPDFGIAPGSLVAIATFRRMRGDALTILTLVTFGTSAVTLWCAAYPSTFSLVTSRAVGGLLWAHAATHYPVWIDRRAHHSDSRTLWLAGMNVSLLFGVLAGYVVGGAARTFDSSSSSAGYGDDDGDGDGGGDRDGRRLPGGSRMVNVTVTWVDLYFLEGFLMLACGAALLACFDRDLVRIDVDRSSTTPTAGGAETTEAEGLLRDGSGGADGREGGAGGGTRRRRSSEIAMVDGEDDHRRGVLRDEDEDENGRHEEDENMWDLLLSLLRSAPFLLAVALTACISGSVVFALYFITQVCEARGLSDGESVLAVAAVFVTAPAPGMMFGSWAVNCLAAAHAHAKNRLRLRRQRSRVHPTVDDGGDSGGAGYEDHVATFGVALASALAVLVAAILFPLSRILWRDDDDDDDYDYEDGDDDTTTGEGDTPGMGDRQKLAFAGACWLFFFAGGMAGPPLNGVAVSVVPGASHLASGLQFSMANAAKILVPQVGGIVIDRVGLVDGFDYTILVCTVVFVLLSGVGLIHARRCEGGECNDRRGVCLCRFGGGGGVADGYERIP